VQDIINQAWEQRTQLSSADQAGEVGQAVAAALDQLESGEARVAEPTANGWQVNDWLKKAVLLSFRLNENQAIMGSVATYFDKVPLRFGPGASAEIAASGARVVPPATVRRGVYLGKNVVLMPSYVNIGAFVDQGTMVDTWATVGSCAQVGKNVHLSGGVGIGGVLEPLQASPTIIEDDCFIGARSEIVEGVIVEKGAVISMGVFIGQSTRIYNRETEQVSYGRVPSGAVVVPGALPSKDGKYSLACAVIVKQVDEKTRSKVGVNELLREATES